MSDEPKRRSGSFGSQLTAEASSDISARKLSMSDPSIVDKETSPQSNASPESHESSPSGTLKKPRKFKPRKYIAKKLKLRKSDKGDDQDQAAGSQSEQESIKTSSSVSSKLSEKLSSPKLQRFNFVKRFSGRKSYQVSPISDDGDDSKERLRSLSVSESSIHEEKTENEPQNFVSEVQIPLIPTNTAPVTLESKKVELKITMAKYEKRSLSPSALERAPIDKASSEDIELPRANRDEYFARPPYMEQQEKPINEEETFAAVVRDGLTSVKPKAAENQSEVEKYSILTSSLQTILSTAKDLEEFGASGGVEESTLKFPVLPDLKILEEGEKEVEGKIVKREASAVAVGKTVNEAPVEEVGIEELTKETQIKDTVKENSKELPVSKDSEQLPVGKDSEQLPVGKDSKQLPVSKDTEQLPVGKDSKQLPVSKDTEQLPVGKDSKQLPVSKDTEQLPVSKDTEQLPVGKDSKQLPANSETLQNPLKGAIPKQLPGKTPSLPVAKNPPSQEASKETQEKSEFFDIFQKVTKPSKFDTSTPTRPEVEDQDIPEVEDSDDSEMRKQQKKSKIPVEQKRLSASFDASTATSTVHTQEARNPYHVNLSASSSSESSRAPSESNLTTGEIKFEVGTPVKNFPSPTGSANVIAPLAIPESSTQNSIDDVFHSPKSQNSLQPESITRRKIAYVPQLTIYTAEEQELLKSNFAANADSFDLSSTQADSSVFPVFDDSVGSTMTNSPDKREHLYKILVIGELGTGKTSFIKRYVHQFFSQNYRATIGVDFALKVLNWDQSTIIRLQLWDIAGQERFGNMTRVYYKEAVGAFIVFDVTRSATFDAVIKWKQDLDAKVQLPDGSPIPTILLANKCDQQKQGLVTMPAKMDDYCKQNGFAGWFETSAKDNVNIEESAKALVSKILVNDKLINHDVVDGDRILLDTENPEKKKSCSC